MSEIKTRGDLLNYLTRMAEEYIPQCKESVVRNEHMNEVDESIMSSIGIEPIKAILVDFVNFIGGAQCLDWGLYTKDLNLEKSKKENRVKEIEN